MNLKPLAVVGASIQALGWIMLIMMPAVPKMMAGVCILGGIVMFVVAFVFSDLPKKRNGPDQELADRR